MDLARKRQLVHAVPAGCGVYLFLDPQAFPLYIGKAVNLRQRVLQHLRSRGSEAGRRLGMLRQVERIGWIPCPTELHALLLEDELIKSHLPPYNRRQKRFTRSRYLAFDGGPYPALRLLDREEVPGRGEVFGPFRSESFARLLLQVAQRYLHLRTCPDPLTGRACVRGSLGLCPAPCAREAGPAEYAEVVRRTRRFLLGDMQDLPARMELRMKWLSRSRQFERAAEVRDQLQFILRFASRQRFYLAFRARPLALHSRGSWPGTYLFQSGRLVHHSPRILEPRECAAILGDEGAAAGLPGGAAGLPGLTSSPAGPGSRPGPLPEEILFDRALILSTWQKLDPGNRSLVFLP